MEYAKDIILEQGQVVESELERKKRERKKCNKSWFEENRKTILKKDKKQKIGYNVILKTTKLISEYKIITTIVIATISFMILDIVLINSFINMLGIL